MPAYTSTVDPNTFAYTIYADGVATIIQPFPAGAAGTAPFPNAAAAAAEAASVIASLSASS